MQTSRADVEAAFRDLGRALSERGRVLSAKNEKALRDGMAALAAVLSALDKEETPDNAEAALEAAREAISQADLSYTEQERLVRAAAKARYPGPGLYVWAEAVYADSVIVRVENELNGQTLAFKHPWTMADGTVQLGDGVAVQQVTRWEPVTDATSEAAELAEDAPVALREALGLRAGQTLPVKIIGPGWGSSGYYSAAMLKRDGPQIFKTGLHAYWDHPTLSEEADRPEGTLRSLAGVLAEDASWQDKGAEGPGLYSRLEVFAPYQEAVEELAPHIGMSIRAYGESELGEAEGKAGRIITKLTQARSVDFVTVAGAGGAITGLFEAARNRNAPHNPPTSGGEDVTPEQLAELQESNRKLVEQVEKQTREITALRSRDAVNEARAMVAEAMGRAELPQAAKDRLGMVLAVSPPLKDGALDREALSSQIETAVKAEAAYIESIGAKAKPADSPVTGMGSTTSPVSEAGGPSEADALKVWEGFGLTPEQAKIAALGRAN